MRHELVGVLAAVGRSSPVGSGWGASSSAVPVSSGWAPYL